MRRIDSRRVPSETRKTLRERLARFLPTYSTPSDYLVETAHPTISDQEFLKLLLNLELLPSSDAARARTLYDQAVQSQSRETNSLQPAANSDPSTSETSHTPIMADRGTDELCPPPSFDELVTQGWIRLCWDRFSISQDLARASFQSQATGNAFKLLIGARYQDQLQLRPGFNPGGELQTIATRIVSQELKPSEVACLSQPWIVARIWDTPLETSEDERTIEQRLSHWIDCWCLLHCPSFQISNYLELDSFKQFTEIAISILNAASTSPTWEEFQLASRMPMILKYPHRVGSVERIVGEIPNTTIERIYWLSNGVAEATFYEYMETRCASILSALLNELQYAPFDALKMAPQLMQLIVERPVMLQQLVLRVRQAPIILADMLMSPKTCPLACSLIANWVTNTGAWNRNFQAQANEITETLAFEDAIAILGGHLDENLISANELAALYFNIYELASNRRGSSRYYGILSLLRQELTVVESNLQVSTFIALVSSPSTGSDAMTAFCAALDFISEGGGIDRIDPSQIVSLYLDTLLLKGERIGLKQLELNAAQSFFYLVLRCEETLRNRFFNALNVLDWLQTSIPSNDQLTFHHLLANRIRLHIRLLSRAMAGWPNEVPQELVEALSTAIHTGAINHHERGRIDAFVPGPGFGSPWAEEKPISLDLAAALQRLQGNSLQTLLNQLCQIEEPIVLAGIVAHTPLAIHEPLKRRLQTLTPENSSGIWSWSALQARIDALLNAELPDIAEIFIAEERSAQTFGPVPGREIASLRVTLRMLLLRQAWPAVMAFNLPADMNEATRQESDGLLQFYKGIAELKRPDGDPAAAEAIFLNLTRRQPNVTAYLTNLFACRVSRLLRNDSFGILSGDAMTEAKRYLAEVQQEVLPLVDHFPPDLKIVDTNRAMLLLAINQPRESLQILINLTDTNFDENIEGFRALSLARIDRKSEAEMVLHKVEQAFGRSDFISAIRANIDNHRPYATSPSILLNENPLPKIRHAFEFFLRLEAAEQAEILQSRGRLDLYLLEQVRGACSSIVALAPMMRNLGMSRYEDDISGVLKQILRSRLIQAQWAVEDQPRGGFSQTGGVGERDITITKGSATLAVIEALIVDSVERGNLTSHFNKLLGYDQCRFFFHITYSRTDNCTGILNHLRTACGTPPSGFHYDHLEELEDNDSMPIGFKAFYEVDSRRIIVVFLVLDIGQPNQRGAAALAAS